MNNTNTMNNTNIAEIIAKIESQPARSAWRRAIKSYAIELIEDMDGQELTPVSLLNGAENWRAYSYGGSSLIYDADIAERICTPSGLIKSRNGERAPNKNESWLDVQTRALYQASRLVMRISRSIMLLA